MKDFNLLELYRIQMKKQRFQWYGLLSGMILFLITIIIIQHLYLVKKKRQLINLQNQLIFDLTHQSVKQLQHSFSFPQQHIARFLSILPHLILPPIRLNQLMLTSKTLSVKGHASSLKQVIQLIDSLRQKTIILKPKQIQFQNGNFIFHAKINPNL